MFPSFDLSSFLFGLMLGYFISGVYALLNAGKQKKKAEQELEKIESNLKNIQDDLAKKKKELEAEMKKRMEIK